MTASVRRVPDLLRFRAQSAPDQLAHDDLKLSLTLGEWDRFADEIGGGLAASGVGVGDRVLLPVSNANASLFAVAYMAVLRAGAIAVPLSTRLKAGEVAAFAEHVGAEWAITDRPDLLARTSLKQTWSVDALPKDLGALPDQEELDPDQACDILPTSGTTGMPKGVVSTHADMTPGLGTGTASSPFSLMLQALPFTGSGGCHSIMTLPLKTGAAVLTQPSFDPEGFLQLIAERRPQAIQAVPAMLRLIVDHPRAFEFDVSSLKYVFTGTAPLPHDTAQRLTTLWPAPRLVNLYGMSEAGAGSQTRSRASVLKPGSVGAPAEKGAIEIRDEQGGALPHGSQGEIWTRALRPRRYWNDPEGTAATWKDGWVKTGDLGYFDAEGDLIITGRLKEIIIRGGYNIAPAEVEDVLMSHPSVAEAAVYGVPHAVLGEDVAAAVVLRAGAQVTPEELRAWCSQHLADNKVPRAWRFVAELPKNQNGKVLKRELIG